MFTLYTMRAKSINAGIYKAINAWSRLFALFAIALLVLTTLGMALLIRGGPDALRLLRRVASRRSDRCELDIIGFKHC
jgi:hypothetical protein